MWVSQINYLEGGIKERMGFIRKRVPISLGSFEDLSKTNSGYSAF
jgi:hypothetical protein